MCSNDVQLFAAQAEFLCGIVRGNARVIDRVPLVARMMPIVEVEVMKKGTTDKSALVSANTELKIQAKRPPGNPDAVLIGAYSTMLFEIFHAQCVFRETDLSNQRVKTLSIFNCDCAAEHALANTHAGEATHVLHEATTLSRLPVQ